LGFRDTLRAIQDQEIRPDAATFSHLYRQAVSARHVAGQEAQYRGSVDRNIYESRRPGGENIVNSPWALPKQWRQVVRVSGTDPTTGQSRDLFVNIDTDRLLTRGEAIEQATIAAAQSPLIQLFDADVTDYETTWRSA
jgi:hypothetical protein